MNCACVDECWMDCGCVEGAFYLFAMDANSLPFAVEYSPSGRACCLTCREEIPEGVLRCSKRIPSPFVRPL